MRPTILKPHQKNGVLFMFNQTFDDIDEGGKTNAGFGALEKKKKASTADAATKKSERGCILAHHMGLGKTLQVITLLHTVSTHPNFADKRQAMSRNLGDNRINSNFRVLILCPKNVASNWMNEFTKWYVGRASEASEAVRTPVGAATFFPQISRFAVGSCRVA